MKKKIWKKIVGLLCMLSLVVTSSGIEHMGVKFGITAEAEQITEDGIEWEENEDGTVTVTGYSGANTEVTIPDMINGKKVIRIGEQAFSFFRLLTKIILPEGLVSIGDNAFEYCSSLTEINLPEGLVSIGKGVFDDCYSLTKIILPENLISIEEEAFDNCQSLTKIILPEGLANIGKGAFRWCKSLTEIILPENLVNIGEEVFQYCESLTKVTLPQEFTNIRNGMFLGCSGLTEIELPKSLVSIGNEAFCSCSSLREINLPENLISIGEEAFENCNALTEIKLPESLIIIGERAFGSCDALTEIELPANVRQIGSGWISGKLLVNINVSLYNTKYTSYNNCLYNKDLTELFTFPSGKSKLEFSKNIVSIGDGAFSGCENLIEIDLPETIENIGEKAFQGCRRLEKIKLPETLKNIKNGTFEVCEKLRKIDWPKTLESIGDRAFIGCGFIEINFPETLKSIGDHAFWACQNLIKIDFPETLENIEDHAFFECDNLTEIKLPEYMERIGSNVFGCCNLMNVKLPKNLERIESYTFLGNINLNEITLPKDLNYISDTAFSCCQNLTLYVIQDSYAEKYAKENNLPYKYYNSDKEVSSSQYSFIFYDEDKNTPISQDIKAIYNNQELKNLEGKFVFEPVSGQGILTIEYQNQTYTYNLSAFERGKTNIVHISAPSDTNAYTMKIYATQPFANLRTGSKIGINAVLYKNGVVDTSSKQFSLIVSDNNIVSSERYNKENDMDGCAWELTGVREGTVAVTITDTKTKVTASINLVVDDKAYTYSANYLTSSNFNKYLCTGFMYADSFKQTSLDNGNTLFSFNVYNSGYSSGAVEVYYADGKLKSAVHVKKYKNNSSLSDFAKDAWSLYCDITSGRLFQYNQESICEKTEVEVIVPNGGSVKLVSDWKESQVVAAYNMVDIVMGAMKFGDKIKDIFARNSKLQEMVTANCYKKVTDKVIACQLKEMEEILMTCFSDFWKSNAVKLFMDNLKDKSFSTITDTMVENILLNDGDGILNQIEEFWKSLDIQMEDVIEAAINDSGELNGIPFMLDVLGEGLPTAKILKAAFAGNELSSYLLNLAYIGKTTGIGSLDIVFRASDNQMYSMGISAEGDMLNQDDNIVFHSYLIKDEDERYHTVENTASELGKHFVAYDIGMKKNGKDMPVTGRIKVTMPVPDGFNPYYSRVYWIKDDGTYKFIKTTLENGALVFYTDHFSMYAIVEENNLSGDVNKDGKINIKDSALTRRHVAKWKVEIDLNAADVNKDGKVTIKDSALIRRYVAKWDITLL